jgi:hypothetical protein
LRKVFREFFVLYIYNKMTTNQVEKTIKKIGCELCDFKCSKRQDYNRHLLTQKHTNATKYNQMQKNEGKKSYQCQCSKTYTHRASLYNHRKKCDYIPPNDAPEKKPKLYEKDNIVEVLMQENMDFKNIILELVKNNGNLQKQMSEVCKGSVNNSYNNNKTFNLQFFLNEQCKDAMNMVDFVNSMTLEFSDLEEVGKLGYVEGISNIIIRKLNALDIYKRPIHCSDGKREIMYVKEDDVWEKENNTYDKLRKVIKQVTYKNSSLLVPWSQQYPNCMNNQHSLNDVYVQMMGQAMGGKESFLESENKIMKKIAKAVLITK